MTDSDDELRPIVTRLAADVSELTGAVALTDSIVRQLANLMEQQSRDVTRLYEMWNDTRQDIRRLYAAWPEHLRDHGGTDGR